MGLPLVAANNQRLVQVLLNLILNAADAIEGRGAMTIRADADDEDHRVKLWISNTGGVITLHPRYHSLTGPIVAAIVVQPDDKVMFITANGMALSTDVAQIPQSARTARGQIVMNVLKGDRLSAVARLKAYTGEDESMVQN